MSSASPDAILHLTTLHLLSQAGFASTSQAASLTLSTAASKYLSLIARTCVEKALLAGRSKPSAADVVASLADVGEDVDSLWEFLAGDGDEEGEDGRGGGLRWRGGMDGLDDWLAAGKSVEGAIAEMTLVPNDELPKVGSEESDEDDGMDVDVDEEENTGQHKLSFGQGKDHDPMAWLPPLPGHTPPPVSTSLPTIDLTSPSAPLPDASPPTAQTTAAPTPATAAPRSISDRYRHSIPFASSQLASREWVDPLPPRVPRPPPEQTSSFPALLEAYKATASEPSVTMIQSDLRRQATELLRRSIAPADKWLPKDTLSFDLQGPSISPFAASVPEDEKVQPHLIPINPNPTGLLSSLVHQMHSPHLPDALRTRLTGLRPPLPQKDNNGNPIFYGPRVRAPDAAAREKWKGKQVDPSEETYLRYTWDSGPRGAEKYSSAKLPSGKKVIASGEGEDVPRVPAGANKLRIKIERGNSLLSPGGGSAGNGGTERGLGIVGIENEAGPSGTSGIVTSPLSISPGAPASAVTPGQTLKINLNAKRGSISPSPTAPSISPGAAANGTTYAGEGISPKTSSTAQQATPPPVPSSDTVTNGNTTTPATTTTTAKPALKIRLSTGASGAPRS